MLRSLGRSHHSARVARTQLRRIAFGQSVDQLLMKVIMSSGYRRRDSFIVHLARSIYIFTQAIVDIAAAPALLNFLFVVEFDFRNQQTREATRVIVKTTFLFANFNGQFGFGDSVAASAAERRRIAGSKRRRRRHLFGWRDVRSNGR